MPCGPPWISMMSGYFFVRSKLGGLMIQPSTRAPPVETYQMGSVAPRWMRSRTSAFTVVSRATGCARPALVGAIGKGTVVVSRECHGPAVGRDDRARPAALLADDLLDRTTLHIDRVEVRLPIAIVGVGFAQPVEHDGAAVGRPVIIRRIEATELGGRKVTGRELAGRASLSRHEEDLRRALLHEAGAVAAIVQPIDDARRRRPLRAFGSRGHG